MDPFDADLPEHLCHVQERNRELKEKGKCRNTPCLGYYGFRICDHHWKRDCDEDDIFNLKHYFDIKDKPVKQPKNVSLTVKWGGSKRKHYEVFAEHDGQKIVILTSRDGLPLKFISKSLVTKAASRVQSFIDIGTPYAISRIAKLFDKSKMWTIHNDGVELIHKLLFGQS